MSKKKELIEVITNRLNPRYRKEIVPISEEIIPLDILDEKKLKNFNLRGLNIDKEKFNNCNIGTFDIDEKELLELPHTILNLIFVIITIDNIIICKGGGRIILLDISDRSKMKILGSSPIEIFIYTITLVDNNTLAYYGDKKLGLLDISNRVNIKLISNIEVDDKLDNLTLLDENTLIYGEKDKKIIFLDISDKTNIIISKSNDIYYSVNHTIFFKRDILLAISNNEKIILLNISDKKNITILSTYNLDNIKHCILIDNNIFACLYNWNKILLFDIKNDMIKELGEFEISGTPKNIIKITSNLIAIDDNKDILLVDISNKNDITILEKYILDFDIYSMVLIDENTLICGTLNGDITSLNIGNKNNGEHGLIESYGIENWVQSLALIDNNTLVYSSNDKRIVLLDIADRENIKVLDDIILESKVIDISFSKSENIIACGSRDNTVILLNISDNSFDIINSFKLEDEIPSIVFIDKNTLACRGHDTQITLLDISDKMNIHILGQTKGLGRLRHITYLNDNTIICVGEKIVVLLDIKSREMPKVLGVFNMSNWIQSSIVIDRNIIACGGHDQKVTLLDIKDQKNIKQLGNISIEGYVLCLIFIDNNTIAYGGLNGKVALLDISNKQNIKLLGNIICDGRVLTIEYNNDNLLICGGEDSKITLLDITNKTNIKFISSYMPLESNIYETLTPKEWTLVNEEGWEFDNDEQLYRYARLYDPESKKLVPYFDVEGDRVSRSEDGKRLVIKRIENNK